MAGTKGTLVKVRLLPELRSWLAERVKATGQTEDVLVARGVELALAEPELTPQGVAELREALAAAEAEVSHLRSELAAAQRHVEQLTTRLQVDWQARAQARQEERRAASQSSEERRWGLFRRKPG